MTNNNSTWKKYNRINKGTDAQDSAVIDNLSNRVEIQLEKKTGNSYGLTEIDDKKITVTAIAIHTVDGYTGYKHSKTGTFNIEKVRHKKYVVNFPKVTQTISEVHVYYEASDSKLNNPLVLYMKTTRGNTHKYYGRGLKWWQIGQPDTNAPTDKKLKPHLDMMSTCGTIDEF